MYVQILAVVIIVWLLGITALLVFSLVFLRKLGGSLKKEETKKLFEKVLMSDSSLKEKVEAIGKDVSDLKKEVVLHVQKIGYVRYNPFSETGGNNSFSISFLNDNDSGIVITGLHSRQGTRVYAKEVKEGKSELALSQEEKRAIAKAKKV